LLVASVLSCCCSAWWTVESASSFQQADRPVEMVPGKYYSVETGHGSAELNLQFDADSRYVLIVSSLGYAGKRFDVKLSQNGSQSYQPSSLTALKPLVPRGDDSEIQIVSHTDQQKSQHTIQLAGLATATPAEESKREITQRSFHLHVTDGELEDENQYVLVTGNLVVENEAVRVYLDRNQSEAELAPGTVQEVVRLLQSEIIPRLAKKIGTLVDVDEDGKFCVLLTPWLSQLQGGKTSLGGFVRGSDFRLDVEKPFSNHCDMLYLNSNIKPGQHLRDLLLHELTHAVCFSERLKSREDGQAGFDEDDWLNEGIAHLSEEGLTNLDYRIGRFLNAPQNYPLVVPDYYRSGLWRNHGCRGATYLFLRWCADMYGEGFMRKLVHSPVKGVRNIEWATGVPFRKTFRQWSVSLWESEVGSETTSDNFRSKDIRGQWGKWGYVGPRAIQWDLDTGPQKTIQLAGTSTAYLELDSQQIQNRSIKISAPREAKLQLTVVRVESGPTVQASLGWNEGSLTSAARDLTVELTGFDPVIQDIELLACEQNCGSEKKTVCFTGSRLQNFLREVRFKTAAGINRQGLKIQVPGSHIKMFKGPFLLKLLVSDSQGCRQSIWLDADSTENRSANSIQLTGFSEETSP